MKILYKIDMNIIVNETDSFRCNEISHIINQFSYNDNSIIEFLYRYDQLEISRNILLDMVDHNRFDNKINKFDIIYLYLKDDKLLCVLFKNCSYKELNYSVSCESGIILSMFCQEYFLNIDTKEVSNIYQDPYLISLLRKEKIKDIE